MHGESRCGECHEKMADEWEPSPHARSAGVAYLKIRAEVADATCDRCHLPLATVDSAIAAEGVTCDVCHALRDPKPTAAGAGFHLALDAMVKYGPRCDLKDHYFHKMGCSPEHDQAVLCGSCHWYERGAIPVYTEYTEWRDGPLAAKGVACQSCHMPKETAVIATGSPKRPGVPDHGMFGAAGDLPARALELHAEATDSPTGISVTLALANVGAGHSVPSGSPEHRVDVDLVVRDASAALVGQQHATLGRILVDDAGHEVPFWRATKVASDNRIKAGATWTETFQFPASELGPGDHVVTIAVIEDPGSGALTGATLPVPAGATKSVTVKPPPPGKRAP